MDQAKREKLEERTSRRDTLETRKGTVRASWNTPDVGEICGEA
jgi:hypothetical protein